MDILVILHAMTMTVVEIRLGKQLTTAGEEVKDNQQEACFCPLRRVPVLPKL
jgi:hypothetical protein